MTHAKALELVRQKAHATRVLKNPHARTTRAICIVLDHLASQLPLVPMTPHESAARAEAWRRIEERGAELSRRTSEWSAFYTNKGVPTRISENGC